MATVQEKKNAPLPTRLRKLVAEGKWTQKEIADKVGVKPQSISQYLDGTVNPSYSVLISIADLFNVSTDYLLGRTDVATNDINMAGVEKHLGLSPKAISKLMSNETIKNVINHILCSGAASVFAQKAAIIHDSHFMLSQPETNEAGRSYFERNANEQFDQLTALLSVIFTEPDFLSDNLLGTKELYFPEEKTQELIDKYKTLKSEFTKIINKGTVKDTELAESLKRTISTIEKLIDNLSEE